jgi:hypothetical protein
MTVYRMCSVQLLFDKFVEKSFVKIIPDRVVDEALLKGFRLPLGLIPEHNIVIPSTLQLSTGPFTSSGE